MVTSWVVSIFIICVIRFTVGKPKLVPGKGQIIVESIIGALRSILQPIVGKSVLSILLAFDRAFLFHLHP